MHRRIAAALLILFVVTVPAGVLAADSPAGSIRVQLDDTENTDLSLAGAEITIKPEKGKELTAQTDETGAAVFAGLPDGRYAVRITQPPEGMRAAAHSTGTVSVQDGPRSITLQVAPRPPAVSRFAWIDGTEKQVNGLAATAVLPGKSMPGEAEPVLLQDAITLQASGRELMRAVMYYGYSGPGYAAQDGQSEEEAQRAVILARAYAYYNGSKEGETFRKSQDASFWQKHVVPLLETIVYEKGQDGKVLRDVPSSFNPALCNLSDRTTSPVVWLPEAPGAVETALVSTRPEWTDGNDAYSFAGAVFAVLDSADEPVEIAAADGSVLYTRASGRLAALKAPEGYEPPASGETGGEMRFTPKLAAVEGAAPFALRTAHGEDADLEGASYRLALYKDRINGADALSGCLPLMEWIVRPDAEGKITLSADNVRDGDDVPDQVPYGTLELKSISDPPGYAPVHELKIVDGPEALKEASAVKLEPVTAGITFGLTADADYLGAASLEDAVFELTNTGSGTVYVAREPVGPGQPAAQLVSDAGGTVTTSKSLLPAGTYELTMKQGPTGFEPQDFAPATIRVTESGMKNLGDLGGALAFRLVRSDVTMRKTDAAGNPEPDVLIQVVSETTGKKWLARSGEDGVITFEGLPYDTYAAEELTEGAENPASFRFTVTGSGTLDFGTLMSGAPDGLTEENLPDEAPPARIPEWDGEPEGSELLPSPSPEAAAADAAVLSAATPSPAVTPSPSPAATPSPLGADGRPDRVPKTDDAANIWPALWQMILSGLAAGWIVWRYRTYGFVFG